MNHKDILSTIDHRSGMTVPEGYFEDFIKRMEASLPRQEWEQPQSEKHIIPHRNFWQKARPYVYMAAMFAGIWCMMKMFDMMRPSQNHIGLDNNPRLAEAVSDPTYVNDYFLKNYDGMGDVYSPFYDDLYEEGFNPAVLVEATGVEEDQPTSYYSL